MRRAINLMAHAGLLIASFAVEVDNYLLFYDGFQIHLFLDSEGQVRWAIEFPWSWSFLAQIKMRDRNVLVSFGGFTERISCVQYDELNVISGRCGNPGDTRV